MRILPRDIGEWIICAMLVCVIWFGVTAIRARLAIPDPRYDWYQRGPLPIEEQQFNKIGDNVTCIIDANDDLTISTPNGWTTCLRAISCAMPTGEVCTRIPR